MDCEFCKKTFKTGVILKTHQRTAKYCLKIRTGCRDDAPDSTYRCDFCGIFVSTQNYLSRHIKSCKMNTSFINDKIKTYENIIINKDNQIKELNERYTQVLIDKDKQDVELGIYKKIASSNQDSLVEIAKQPRNNIQTNILMTMTPMDINEDTFGQNIKDLFTRNYLLAGQKGAAKFAFDHLLKDEHGKLKYICTDPSRSTFRYRTNDGVMERDVKAKKLTDALSATLIKQTKMLTMGNVINCNPDAFFTHTTNFQDIQVLPDDNSEFRIELASLTTV